MQLAVFPRFLSRSAGAALATTPIAKVQAKDSPFAVNDLLCAAPMAVFRNELYAGGQRGGTLYKLVEEKAQ